MLRCKKIRVLLSASLFTLGAVTSAEEPTKAKSVPSYARGSYAGGPINIASLIQSEQEDETSATSPSDEIEPAANLKVDGPSGDGADDTLREALRMLEDGRTDDPLDSGTDAKIQIDSLFSGRETEYGEGGFKLPPLEALTTSTENIGNGIVPEGYREGGEPVRIPLPESGMDRGAPWQWTTQYWAASNTFSHPLYFEDRMLERHGHQRCPHLQPLVSGGRFALQFAALPYLTAISPSWECDYSLGYYRAGNCVPIFLQRAPWKRKAAAAQMTAIAVGGTVLP